MITAIATGEGDKRIILLGIARGNIDRLTKGMPLRVTAETHPGFPADLVVMVFFKETERELVNELKSFISDSTKIVTVPRENKGIS